MDQAFDINALRRNRRRYRIDEERHIVIVHSDPHCEPALGIGETVERNRRVTGLAAMCLFKRKPCSLFTGLSIKTVVFAGQGAFSERRDHCLQKLTVDFRSGF